MDATRNGFPLGRMDQSHWNFLPQGDTGASNIFRLEREREVFG